MGLKAMEEINKILETNRLFGNQIKDAWQAVHEIHLQGYSQFERVTVCGMGGSALGGRVVHALFSSQLKASLDVVTEYSIPAYADENTLIVISSYSGNTEETISCFREALQRNLKIFAISAGGEVQGIAQENSIPHYKIEPVHNPSNQPRMAVGYSIGGLLALLSLTGLVHTTSEEIDEVVLFTKNKAKEFEQDSDIDYNHATQLAGKIHNKLPILVASEHLTGAAHVITNQLNESAKSFAASFDLPELNHHLMEGLVNPKELTRKILFLLFESDFYHERVKKRYPLTKEVVEKNMIETHVYKASGATPLKQAVEVILLGSYLQAYLALEYRENPLEIPWVDYFKEKLVR